MNNLLYLVPDDPLTEKEHDLPPAVSVLVKGGVPLISFEFGLKQQMTTDVSNSARISGRPQLSDLVCEKEMDEVSPHFSDICLKGKTLGETCRLMVISLDETDIQSIMQYSLTLPMVTSYQVSSIEGQTPRELIHLNYTSIEQTYTYHAEGGPKTSRSGWDVSRNRPL